MMYFGSFPTILYSNTSVADISRRIKIVDRGKNSPFYFHPYDITTHLRSDQIAEYYYDNSFLDWLIYVSNDIVDPYYDWYLSEEQLDQLIRSKYGSVETSKRKIKYFVNNWFEHPDEEISVSHYENTLARPLKKYFDPKYSESGKILSYRRRRVDTTMNTNRIIDYTIDGWDSGNTFHSGELVKIWQPGEWVGSGEAVFSNSTTLRVQSVLGNTFANSTTNVYIVGETSTSSASVNNSNTIIENIGTDENVFWSPMYYYDWEIMRNEQKRTIHLVDSSAVPFLLNTVREKLRQP